MIRNEHDRIVILFPATATRSAATYVIEYDEKEQMRFPTFEQFVENYRSGWGAPVKYIVQRVPPVGSLHWNQAD